MRIVIDGRVIQDHFPGIARYTFNLTHTLAKAYPADRLFLLHNPDSRNSRYSLAQIKELSNIRLLPSPTPIFSLRSQWEIPQTLRRVRPDLIHAPYYIRPYKMPAPVVLTIYDLIPLVCPQYFTLIQRLLFRAAMMLSLANCRHVICISQATARDLQHFFGYPSSRLSIIAPGIETTFKPHSAQSGLPGGPYVVYVGSNKPHKNLVTLVGAWAQVKARSTHQLVIAGRWDPRFPEAKRQVEKLNLQDTVFFTGDIAEPDLPALYSGADLFVFPSLYEGFGFPILEAMACGTPVICSNTSSLPEIASDAAILIDPTIVQALATAIDQVLSDEDLRRDLASRGLRRAAEFPWPRAAQSVRSVYDEIISAN